MKIVYIGNNLQSKNPTTQALLSRLLVEQGFDVQVYSNKENKFLRLIAMCLGIIKNRKSTDYILIDTYSTLNFYFALITSQLARLFTIKYIPILHGGNLCSRLKNSKFYSNLIFSNSYINVSPSKYLLNEFENNGYKTMFIPNAIETSNYKFIQRKNFDYKLLWVRAFDKIYNPIMAVKVLIELINKGYKVKLCMVGPDKDGTKNEVVKLAEKKNVLPFLEITGRLSKAEWIHKAKEFDIFLNTTTVDNAPVSVIEAMALGLPVVSTNVGGIPYLIENNVNGLLVESNNENGMANAIFEFIENPIKTQIITKNARKLVEEFDVENVKEKWLNLLSK